MLGDPQTAYPSNRFIMWQQADECLCTPASEWYRMCVLLWIQPGYLNFYFCVMGFDMSHFLQGKHWRPQKVNVAEKPSRQNIKTPSNKNFTNALGLGLQVRQAGVTQVLVLGETLFVPLGCCPTPPNKLLKDLYLSSLFWPAFWVSQSSTSAF